jgi:5'-methylthioadenosine phosphorylase
VINNIFNQGRYICTEGPAFESCGEITAFQRWGADMVGHTLVPLAYYLRELEICFNAICIVSNVCQGYHCKAEEEPMFNNQDVIDAFSELFYYTLKYHSNPTDCACNTGSFWLRKPEPREKA